jgi:hypothetical protein
VCVYFDWLSYDSRNDPHLLVYSFSFIIYMLNIEKPERKDYNKKKGGEKKGGK